VWVFSICSNIVFSTTYTSSLVLVYGGGTGESTDGGIGGGTGGGTGGGSGGGGGGGGTVLPVTLLPGLSLAAICELVQDTLLEDIFFEYNNFSFSSNSFEICNLLGFDGLISYCINNFFLRIFNTKKYL